jgi:hypothetical protein
VVIVTIPVSYVAALGSVRDSVDSLPLSGVLDYCAVSTRSRDLQLCVVPRMLEGS